MSAAVAEDGSERFGQLQDVTEKPRYTDTANAERLLERHGDKLRFVPEWGWLVWDGKRWRRDASGQVMELAKETIRNLRDEAVSVVDSRRREELERHANGSEARAKLYAMVDLARTDPRVVRSVEDFDTDPFLFNVQNGTLDLRTGEPKDHDPNDHITKLSPATWDPKAHSEVFEAFLESITCGDRDLATYLQEALGYSLTGDTREKGFFFCYGPNGNNGKSTLLEAFLYLMGDYGTTIDPQALMAGNSTDRRNVYAGLVGARFVLGNEPEDGQRLAMGEIKRLTGRDTIRGRYLYKDDFSFVPQLKLWLAANDRPDVRDASDAA